MDIYITDQERKFPKYLERLCKCRVMQYEISKLKEKRTETIIDTPQQFEDIDLAFLFAYKVFPGHIMSYLAQWTCEGREMQVGDTILQQVFIPPFRQLSQKIVFGVRITEIIDEPGRRGFSYETLEGHVEKGVSTFTVEKGINGKVIFVVHTYSTPANVLTRLLGPVFSVPYQAYCTGQALKNVKGIIEAQGKTT